MALQYLESHRSKLNAYISLCTPHLGAGATSDALFNLGFSMLLKFSKETIMSELAMAEVRNIEETTLFKLSNSENLKLFKKLCFVSSPQDNFSPPESSLILASETFRKSSMENKHHAAQVKMIQNIMGQISCDVLIRMTIDYRFESSSIDTFIGRAAHIACLNNPLVVDLLASRLHWLINN